MEVYGKFTDSNKGSEDNKEYYVLSTSVSPTFSVRLEYIESYNEYGRMESTVLYITYQDDSKRLEAENYQRKSKQSKIEL